MLITKNGVYAGRLNDRTLEIEDDESPDLVDVLSRMEGLMGTVLGPAEVSRQEGVLADTARQVSVRKDKFLLAQELAEHGFEIED